MTGLLLGLAVLAAVVAVGWRSLRRQRERLRRPGATTRLPIAVSGFDEIDADLQERRCDCGAPFVLRGETSRQTRQHRYRIVRLVCPECDVEELVHYDVTAVFH
jgi:hypothetical protein